MNHYDVFISYKQTDLQGDFTPDSEIAATLCRLLEEKGLSVFFSEKTIFEIGISDYKKGIDSALEQTRILVVLASKSEYLTSGWVEYEYESFYEDILSGRNPDGKIFSYTAAAVSASLPRTLSRFQNYTNDRFSPNQIAEFLVRSLGAPKEGKMPETTARTAAPEKIILSEQPDRKGPHKSIYASDYSNEFRRLEIQAQNSAGSDRLALDYLFGTHPWDEDEPLYVIDAGSAYGYVSADRFEPLEQVAKILCLDNNPRTIERASIRFADHPKMIFECFDLESENMEQELEALLEKHHIPHVHIIYSALTLHHLKNPDRVLRRLRKCMDRGSYIILRGSDDGSKLCYPKSDLMESIIQKTMEARGVSDRINGRKIYTQLVDAGFRDVKMFSNMKDLSCFSFDDREALFQESFSYRINYFKKALERDPGDPEAKKNYQWMRDALDEFENQFFQSDFWYCEYDYVGIGRK